MNVSDAVRTRLSVRAFLDTPVETERLTGLLAKASRAPSGGNLQPWRIFLLNGRTQDKFKAVMRARLSQMVSDEKPAYAVYPQPLHEPYRSARFKVGEDMYALLGIPREAKDRRFAWLANNFQFFGAPASLFCFVDRVMGPPQWSDLGMFLQTFMLLLREDGLDSCPQECWARFPRTVAQFVGAPEGEMLFCGMSIGYRDTEEKVNTLVSDRMPVEDFTTIV